MNIKATDRGIICKQDAKGNWSIMCRKCTTNKAAYFYTSKSKYDYKLGWVDEYHICKSCFNEERKLSSQEYRNKIKLERIQRWNEYCSYMDDLMVNAD